MNSDLIIRKLFSKNFDLQLGQVYGRSKVILSTFEMLFKIFLFKKVDKDDISIQTYLPRTITK